MYAKDTVITLLPGSNSSTITFYNEIADIDDNLDVYISCYFKDTIIRNNVYVSSSDLIINDGHNGCIPFTKESPHIVFGSFYERWGQFLYLTDTIPDTNLFALMDIEKIEALNKLNSGNVLTFVDTVSIGDTITKVEQYSQMHFKERMDFLRQMLMCLPMFNDQANWRHVGIYPIRIKGADINLGGIPCYDTDNDEEEPCGESPYTEEGGSSGGGGGSGSGSGSTPIPATEIASYGLAKKSMSENTSYTWGWSLPGISKGKNSSISTNILQEDMMDLNGDGYPDLIRNGYVYFSKPKASTWEDPVGLFLNNPHHKSKGTSQGVSYTADPLGFIRLTSNGAKGKITITKANSKKTFNPSVTMGKSETYSEDNTVFTLIDINGDGLPDKISKLGKSVSLGLGYTFDTPESWTSLNDIGSNLCNATSLSLGGSVSTTFPVGSDFSGGDKSYSGGLSSCTSINQTKVMLADLNGDGLPDKITFINDTTLAVYFNIGCGFDLICEEITLNDFYFYNWNVTSSLNGNFGFTVGFTIFSIAKVSASGGADASYSMSSSNIQFMDMDGDGVADLVFTPDTNVIAIRYSNLGRTGLLKTITNPMGGSITLAYHKTPANVFHSRRWVMDTVIVRDMLPGDGADYMMTTYAYDTGYYDRKERIFYGFAKVTETHYNGTTPYRQTARYYRNDSIHTKGLLVAEYIMNANNMLYIYKRNLYELKTPYYGSTSAPTQCKFPAVVHSLTCYFEGFSYPTITQTKTFTYGAYGNLIHQSLTSTSMDTVNVNISYHPQQNGNYCVGIPKSVEVPAYRKRTTQIDNKGRFTDIMIIITQITIYARTWNTINLAIAFG